MDFYCGVLIGNTQIENVVRSAITGRIDNIAVLGEIGIELIENIKQGRHQLTLKPVSCYWPVGLEYASTPTRKRLHFFQNFDFSLPDPSQLACRLTGDEGLVAGTTITGCGNLPVLYPVPGPLLLHLIATATEATL